MRDAWSDFFKLESAGGICLVAAALLAMAVANSPLAVFYDLIFSTTFEIRLGEFGIAKPLLLWVNDGFMAVFFFVVGLELKREVMEGELSDPSKLSLPAFGVLGGMLVPAAIYAWINWDDPMAIRGWAIPAATDIAFALGILSLLGNRVPSSLKIFLVSLAIFDDLGAIIIIAIFYTADVSLTALAVAAVCLVVLLSLNRRRVTELAPYLFVGLIMWTAVLKSGVHSTLAGVTLAFFIPMRDPARPERSPVRDLEHDLHTVVAFGILPIFAFANAGISLAGIGMDALLHTVPLGIIAGLVIGKQVGIVGFAGLAILLGWARLPRDAGWMGLYGTALLCGVGFTMSLFIGSLAFPEADATLLFDERVGIILGSLMSGLAGYFVLRSLPRPKAQ